MSIPFTFYTPTKILFGRGRLRELGTLINRLGDKALLVTGRTFARRYGYIESLTSSMEGSGVKVSVFDSVEQNPSFETVELGSSLGKNSNVDFIVGFGGGSVIDAAKAIALLCVKGGDLRSYIYPYVVEDEVLPVVAIPTTCGTGSEVTRYSLLSDLKAKRKVVIAGYPLTPKIAVIDPDVLKHLPASLTVYTALDAFSHAIEAYWSKSSQPLSDLFALECMKIILRDLKGASYKPEARGSLHYASLLGGLAINCAGTTVIHGLGYYLTTHHEVHHGLANSIFLPLAVIFNASEVLDKILRLLDYLGFEYETADEAVNKLVETIVKVKNELGVPTNLRSLGVKEDEIDVFIYETMQYKRNLENNPRVVSEEDVRRFFIKVF
ncbi:iron-containing alcohol dehydrogenase [Candidatus Bathyarchaeota archaeon]|nr:iron-containing alcohol dehydrogenase [Candidatus Bathyarchaeota archaeon]MBS7613422.1 iron-containing alcohol dehydrogenase [Candidatus Bathyarchaeota archaeon]MBS7618749.1 iron-containing alcohol dehydrogenase [Candidatus Bathyarchaeota archaeon]